MSTQSTPDETDEQVARRLRVGQQAWVDPLQPAPKPSHRKTAEALEKPAGRELPTLGGADSEERCDVEEVTRRFREGCDTWQRPVG
jgi:hypothetical protein